MNNEELIEKVFNLPIRQVVEGEGIKCFGTGDNLHCISPFRVNAGKTSSNICISKNIFKDWKLDIVLSPISFIKKLRKTSFTNAVKYLAVKHLGMGDEIKDFKVDAKTIKAVEQANAPVHRELDVEKIDKVYRVFLSLCTLSEEHKQKLMEERQLTEREIEAYGFKTFPRRTVPFKEAFEAKLKEECEDAELADIPGFFKKKTDKYYSFPYLKGIIIPITDERGKIRGLQIRKDVLKDDNDVRYTWFSSSFAIKDKDDYLFDGLGPGAPIFVNYGRFGSRNLYITEGVFKSIAITKYFGSPSISVQGVTNWRPILAALPRILDAYRNIRNIIIAYDADVSSNLNVGKQVINIYDAIQNAAEEQKKNLNELVECREKLKNAKEEEKADIIKQGKELKAKLIQAPDYENINIKFMTWNEAEGKGIDDLINNTDNAIEHIRQIDLDVFKEHFKDFFEEARKEIENGAEDSVIDTLFHKYFDEHFWKNTAV